MLVFHIEIREEVHTFTFSEIPLIIGLFFAAPGPLLLARIVGEAVVLVVRERQTLVKLLFNLTLFFAESAVAVSAFSWLIGGRALADPVAWLVALIAIGASDALGVSAVALVIHWHGGHTKPSRLIGTGAVTVVTNTSLGLVGAVLLEATAAGAILLGVLAGLVLVSYRGYSALSQRYSSLQMLYDFTRLVSGSAPARHGHRDDVAAHARPPAGPLHRVVLFGRDGFESRHVVVSGPDDPDSTSSAEHPGSGLDASVLARWNSIGTRVLDQRSALVVPRGSKQREHRELLAELGARDLMIAPLLGDSTVVGLLVVADRLSEVSTFDHDDGRLFETLGRHASVALENGQLIEKLNEQISRRAHEALHDPLTGLPNRTSLHQSLTTALARAGATGTAAAVLLLDLDGFKEINDTLGHQAVIICLKVGRAGCEARWRSMPPWLGWAVTSSPSSSRRGRQRSAHGGRP